MRWRPFTWLLVSVFFFVAAVYSWRLGDEWAARRQEALPLPLNKTAKHAKPMVQSQVGPFHLLSGPGTLNAAGALPPPVPAPSARYPRRLSNTTKTPGQLARSDKAILLENALLDTALPTTLPIPEQLRAKGDPGSYIVQSRGPLNKSFRDHLKNAGASIVSYIPNNAYLVRASVAAAQQLAADPQTQTVLPYEPYYKLKPSLLNLAVAQQPLPDNSALNLLVFADAHDATVAALKDQGVEILGEASSPFGPLLQVRPPVDSLAALAGLPGVQELELLRKRISATDLSRVTVGVSTDSVTTANYLDLSGQNIMVNVNDTGVDANHPDLAGRVFSDTAASSADTDGHGTHVAGIIAGNGNSSAGLTAQGSVAPSVGGQFRGMAPQANLFSMSADLDFGPLSSDAYLQETAARTNALISNNSWHYFNDRDYDLAAASYDAAVRDALPTVSGSQPILYVFAAGNSGAGDDTGAGGVPDTIQSPATAKNVITVGAIEQLRGITNQTQICQPTGSGTNQTTTCETNQPWLPETDSSDEVTSFSSRGNVGLNLEGDFGRFKPDLVAPGTFVVSTRSSQWDTNAYYNPTSHVYFPFTGLQVNSNSLWANVIFVPFNAVGLDLSVFANADSPVPFPSLPIFVKQTDPPPPTTAAAYPIARTNHVSIPPDGGSLSPVNVNWAYAIGNYTTQIVTLDLLTDLTVTNQLGDYLAVLTALNDTLGPFYRYETGTSMAAADVSGNLALMEEFFQRLSLTNSPALMKALLINGARSVSPQYDLQVQTPVNSQGWGLINLTNSIPTSLTNLAAGPLQNSSMYVFDQSPSNALATGQSQTRLFSLSLPAMAQALRFTLVWTDPPGNPVASVKLVNDLDLVVTNLDTGDVFFGNDIISGTDSNQAWDTNSPPNLDTVNNVENVFLLGSPGAALGTNYSVTVMGHRVNVNAVTGHTNDVVQDYALVVSSGDGSVIDALTLQSEGPIVATNSPLVTTVTNSFTASTDDVGGILLNQRAGANTPLLGNIFVPLAGSTRAQITEGITNQWHFFVMTNDKAGFTNAAFLTFLPPNLAVPPMGVQVGNVDNATRSEADIDIYVSRDSDLTNLAPAVLQAADKSIGRGGTEQVVYTNASPGVFYIAIKSEDQEAAEFGFLGVFSDLPFSTSDAEGNLMLRGFPTPVALPDGSTIKPGGAYLFAIAPTPIPVRRVIVTNSIGHQLMGDLLGTLSHQHRFAVLNNHSPHSAITNTYVYDDSDEHDIKDFRGNPASHTDGPGSLQDFAGMQGVGQWMLTMVDNAPQHVGVDFRFTVFVERQQDLTNGNGVVATILPGACRDDFIFVPADATNLTVTLTVEPNSANAGPVLLSVCPAGSGGSDCKQLFIPFGGGTITIDKSSFPPLNAGNYVVRTCNEGSGPITVRIKATLYLDLRGIAPSRYTSQPIVLQDDAVTYSTQFVASAQRIVSVEVGLRLDAPRISDLAFTLISPGGKRILLCENRGGTTADRMGSGLLVTNVFPTTRAGDANADTNILAVGARQGTVIINYDFYTVPDDMQIFYDNNLLFDTGTISGSGQFSVNFGPGVSTNVVIVMNRGNNPRTETLWQYSATVISPENFAYLVFTENTNLTTTPIKFAPPPFGSTNANGFVRLSDFEAAAPGEYFTNDLVDGWNVDSNQVSVISDPLVSPPSGSNVLALASGQISRTLNTSARLRYSLNFNYRGPDIVAWWRGGGDNGDPGNNTDYVGLANGDSFGGATFAPGEVGDALSFVLPFSAVSVRDTNAPDLALTNSLTIEGWVFINGTPANNSGIILARGDKSGNPLPYFLDVEPSNGSVIFNFQIQGASGPAASVISAPIAVSNWVHVAATLDDNSGFMELYVNGILANQITTGVRPYGALDTNSSPGIGIGNLPQPALNNFTFPGLIDELSVYRRALSPSEILAIYNAGSAGKFDSTISIPDALAEAQVSLPGITTNIIFGNNISWQSHPISFVATQNGTPLLITGVEPGILLDSFTLSEAIPSGLFYLPEESLDSLVGDIAFGEWRLEILDSRAGGTNSLPILEAWQLSFTFANAVPLPIGVPTGQPVTNSIPPGQIGYFTVQVPTWANFATNVLLFADGPVNLFFNQFVPPRGTNGAPGDFKLLSNSTGGIGVPILSTNSTPPLRPGSTYYLGVQNLNSSNVNVALEVDFDITPLTNGVPLSSQTGPSLQPRYFYYDVSSNATAVSFQLYNLSGNLDLVARRGFPLPTAGNADFGSFSPGTIPEAIDVLTNSTPPLAAGRYYLGVLNANSGANNYTILATEYSNGIPVIHLLVNGVPFPLTNAGPANAADYFRYTVSTNATGVRFEVNNPTADVTLVARRGLPLPSLASYDFHSVNPGTANELIVVSTNTTPPLTAGDWFLGVFNVGGGLVSYSAKATEITAVTNTNPLVITNWVSSSNSLCLTWTSVPGLHYFVQGKTDLSTTNWTPVSPTIIATNSLTTYCIALPSPDHFFRVQQGDAGPVQGSVTITSISRSTNGVSLQWTAPASSQFNVQWSPTIQPTAWSAFTNIVTSATGAFSFLDDGSQSAGLGATRFYRLLQLP